MGGLIFRLSLPAHRLLLHHGYTSAIHLHIQDRNRFAQHYGQIQLHGSPHLFLLSGGDIFAYGLRRSLHGFGGHLQIGEQFHLLAPLVEGRLLAHHRLHAAHSGGELPIFDVQFDVGGKLAGMAVRTQVVGTRYLHLTHHGLDRLGP